MDLLKSQPDTKFDREFAIQLKQRLINNLAPGQYQPKFKGWIYVLGGALACAVIVIPLTYYLLHQSSSGDLQLAVNPQFKQLAHRAFGSLSFNSSPEESEASLAGKGGGGAATAPTSPESLRMPAPDITNYSFTYQGEEFSLDQSQLEVFRRQKENNSSLPAILQNMNLGLLDLGGLHNTKLQNINILEDQNFGYMVSVNFEEGQIAIYENWSRWPQNIDGSLTRQDIPSNQQLINIANAFMQSRGINLDHYGAPQVNNQWQRWYPAAEAEDYVPDSIPVIYPLILEGQEVFDQGGNPNGITVNVNIRYQRVSGAWNIKTQDYDTSLYPVETDFVRIWSAAAQGGWSYYQYPGVESTINLELDTPELIYVSYYQYTGNTNQEMIVPALRFPVIDNSAAPQKLDQIIVPLVTEMLEEILNRNDQSVLYRQ